MTMEVLLLIKMLNGCIESFMTPGLDVNLSSGVFTSKWSRLGSRTADFRGGKFRAIVLYQSKI